MHAFEFLYADTPGKQKIPSKWSWPLMGVVPFCMWRVQTTFIKPTVCRAVRGLESVR